MRDARWALSSGRRAELEGAHVGQRAREQNAEATPDPCSTWNIQVHAAIVLHPAPDVNPSC